MEPKQPFMEEETRWYRRDLPADRDGSDPLAIRDYAQAVEDMGYHHILAYDHVSRRRNRPDWRGPYSSADQFHAAGQSRRT